VSDSDAFLAQLRADLGASGAPHVGRHPITPTAIADWCDAIGDENPVYTDEAYAAQSIHGGLVAPPATLDIWDRPGLPSIRPGGRAGNDPRSKVIALLEQSGFTSVVAVNSELEIQRYLRPGEVTQNVQILEDVSPEKQTGLGTGHFVTTRHRYTTGDGEHVGDVLFRILKFKPGTGRVAAAGEGQPTKPDPDPSLRPRPAINRDNQFFWDGARNHELRIQRCTGCGALHFPPSPRCWECGAFTYDWVVSSGRAHLYSYAVPHYPQANGFDYPVLVGLVELDEGTRLVSNIVGCRREHLQVGMPLELEWLDSHPALVDGAADSRGSVSLPQFRPATPSRRAETLGAEAVDGQRLPIWSLPVTPTLVVSGALATRDFTEVHHDRDRAVRQGSKDIFLNINTTLGLMARYVTDWAGPEARVTALRVRLGASAYPNDPLTFEGAVQSVDAASGAVTVGVRASNSLGDHASGTVELVLPGAAR
jgi:uncharacterized OB-fold protein/acyl dehydratase